MSGLRHVVFIALLALLVTAAASLPVDNDGGHDLGRQLVKRSPWKPHIHIQMPHIHIPHPHIDVPKLKNCFKAQLHRLPGAVGKALMSCIPSAAFGAPAFGTCVAGNGVMSAARATQHITVCMG